MLFFNTSILRAHAGALRKNLSIAGLAGVMLMPVAANADVVQVNGTGSASCPAGYMLAGVVPRSLMREYAISSAGTNYYCATTTLSGVSGCAVSVKNGCNGCKEYLSPIQITAICARTCSN